MIELIRVNNPLDRSDQERIMMEAPSGTTLEMVVREATANLPAMRNTELAVSVDGALYPMERWGQVILLPEQQVTIIPVLHGGGGGGKNLIRMIGMIIVAVVATIVSYGAATSGAIAAMLGTTVGSATMGAVGAIAGSLVMLAGSMILNAVIPPTRPQVPSLNGYSGLEQSNSYSWNPQTTQQQGTVIPAPYGLCKLTGNVIGAYRQSSGDKQYLNLLISLGEGPLSDVFDLTINGQPVSSFPGVTIHTRLGKLDQHAIPYFGDTFREYPLALAVTHADPALYATVNADFNALIVEISFPTGLAYYSTSGVLAPRTVNYRVEISLQGSGVWKNITKSVRTVTVVTDRWSAGNWGYDADGKEVWMEVTATGYYDPHFEGEPYIESGVDEFGMPYSAVVGVWHWLTGTIVSDETFTYATARGSRQANIRYTHRVDNLAAGCYDIRVSRLTSDTSDARYLDDMYLTAVQEVIYDDFTYPCEALIGIHGLATEKLSGSFRFECKTHGKLLRVYRDGAWHTEASESPAWVAWNILTQPVLDNDGTPIRYSGYAPSFLNLTHWRELADYCADQVPDGQGGTEARLTWNGPFDSQQTMWDAALAVLATGRATPYWRGNIICLAIDKPSDPATMFSVGNILKGSFKESWLSMDGRAGRVEVDFLNQDNNLERDKLTVVNHAAPAGWGPGKLQLQGCIRPSEVIRRCRYHLNTTLYLTRTATLTCDVDSLPVTMGSVVNVQHDVLMIGEGGRISSANDTTITLDKLITIDPDTDYIIDLVTATGMQTHTVIAHDQVQMGNGATVTRLTVADPLDPLPSPYTVYAIGPPDKTAKPWRICDIKPAGDNKREFGLAEYNATIYNSDYDLPVLPTPNYSDTTLETITGLAVAERLVKRGGRGIVTCLDVSWDRPASSFTRFVEILRRKDGAAVHSVGIFEPYDTDTSIEVEDLETYTLWARAIGWFGVFQPRSAAASISHLVAGKTARPSDVTDIWITPAVQSGAIRIEWEPVDDVDLDYYLLKFSHDTGGTWENSVELVKASRTSLVLPAAKDGLYLIKAVDTTGNESENAAAVITTVPALIAYNVQQTIIEDETWSGTKTDCTVVGGDLRLDDGVDSGYYESTTQVDLGEIHTARCWADFRFHGDSPDFEWDVIEDFDACTTLNGVAKGCSIQPEISTSQDGSVWDAWRPFIVGDYSAQKFKFRVKLATRLLPAFPVITLLRFHVDMPDRVQFVADIAAAAGGTAITFPIQFMARPRVAGSIQDATSGDTLKVSGVTAAGCTVRVLNGGSGVARTVDIEAKGY